MPGPQPYGKRLSAGAYRMRPYVEIGIPVGADSISARKICGCRYVPRATNGRPYMCYDKNGLFSLNGFGDGIGVASLAGVIATSGITAA